MFDALYSRSWHSSWFASTSAFETERGFATGEPLTYGETVELARLLRICVKWKVEVMLRKNRCHDFNGLRACMRELKNPNWRSHRYW